MAAAAAAAAGRVWVASGEASAAPAVAILASLELVPMEQWVLSLSLACWAWKHLESCSMEAAELHLVVARRRCSLALVLYCL